MMGPAASGRNRYFFLDLRANPLRSSSRITVTVTGEQLNPMISRIFSVCRSIWTPGPAQLGQGWKPKERNDCCPDEGVVIVKDRD